MNGLHTSGLSTRDRLIIRASALVLLALTASLLCIPLVLDGDSDAIASQEIHPRAGNTVYGYDQFASEDSGSAKQTLYYQMYTVCEGFADSDRDLTAVGDHSALGTFDYRALGLSDDEAISVWSIFILENPAYYWVSNTVNFIGSSMELLIDSVYADHSVRDSTQAAIDRMEMDARESLSSCFTDLDKLIAIHDFVASSLTYAYKADGVTPEDAYWAHSLAGAAVYSKGVCEAYADAFQYLCLVNGFDTVMATGTASGDSHVWNLVDLDGRWYGVDVTWDDENNRYDYLGMSRDRMYSTRDVSEPGISDTGYAYVLPELSDRGIELVYLFEDGINRGAYANIDAAFSDMRRISSEYELRMYGYSAWMSGLFSGNVVDYLIESPVTPAVKSLTIIGAREDIDIYFVSSLITLSSPVVELGSDLTISDVRLAIDTLDIGSHTLRFLGGGGIYDTDEDSIIISDSDAGILYSEGYNNDIFTKVNVHSIEGDSVLLRNMSVVADVSVNTLRIMTFEGTPVYRFGSVSAQDIEISDGSTIEIGSLSSPGDYVHIYILSHGEEGYPDLSIGSTDTRLALNIQPFEWIQSSMPDGSKYVECHIGSYLFHISMPLLTLRDHDSVDYQVYYSYSGDMDLDATSEYYFDSAGGLVNNREHNAEGFLIDGDTLLDYNGDSSHVIVPDGITAIGMGAFENRTAIRSIVLPDSVTSIGSSAFMGCTGLSTVVLGGAAVDIGSYAFAGCTGLTSMVLPDSARNIGAFAFEGCTALRSIDLAEIVYIGYAAFGLCESLRDFSIPSTVSYVGDFAFTGCMNLETITLPSAGYVGEMLFNGYRVVDSDGVTVLEQTSENLRGATLKNIGDCTLKKASSSSSTDFTVVWKGWDGTVLWTGSVPYGETPVYGGGQLSRDGTADTRYVFAGWMPLVGPVTSDTEYTAVYQTQYSLTMDAGDSAGFSDISGTSETVECGSSAVLWYDEGSVVRFKATAGTGYEVSVSGADSLMADGLYQVEMNAPRIVAATVSPSVYNVTIIGEGVSVHSGSETVLDGGAVRYGQVLTVSLAERTGYNGILTCTNNGESDPMADGQVIVAGDIMVSGVYSPMIYAITWTDWDGIILMTDHISSGSSPEYNGQIPLRDPDSTANYSFIGWSTDGTTVIDPLPAVSGDVTYIAVYASSPRPQPYTVTFGGGIHVSADGNEVASGDAVAEGTSVSARISVPEGKVVSSVVMNGEAAEVSKDAADIASEFLSSAAYGSWSIRDADDSSATLVQSYTTASGRSGTKQILISASDDYDSLSAMIAGYPVYSVVDTSSIVGAEVTAAWRAMGTAFLVKIAAAADGYVANGVFFDDTNTYIYLYDPSITHENIADAVLTIAEQLVSALRTGTVDFVMPATDVVIDVDYSDPEPSGITGTTGDCTWTLRGTSLVISGNGAMADYDGYGEAPWGMRITDVVIEDGVTRIGSFSFCWCYSLVSVSIPESVTSIGDCAFLSSNAIESVELPASLEDVGYRTFVGCSSLESIRIPDSNRNYATVDGILFDKSMTTLIHYPAGRTDSGYEIPSSVVTIGDDAFADCSALVSVSLPDSLTTLGERAFSWCTSLTSLDIPDSVTGIGFSAFGGCTGLVHLSFGTGLAEVGRSVLRGVTLLDADGVTEVEPTVGNLIGSVFDGSGGVLIRQSGPAARTGTTGGCTWTLKGASLFISGNGAMADYGDYRTAPWGDDITDAVIGEGITAVGAYAFAGCGNLVSVSLPSTLLSVGAGAFGGCDSLTGIIIPDSVRSIGDDAFFNSGLESVVIPDSVEGIGTAAFGVCLSLAAIEVSGSNAVYRSIDGVLFDKDGGTLIQYPAGRAGASYPVPEGVTSIGDWAFGYCVPVETVSLPSTLLRIGESAFESCVSLGSVVIPDGVETVERYAFFYCTSLRSVSISDSVTYIGDMVFYGCTSLEWIRFSDSLEELDGNLFGEYGTVFLLASASGKEAAELAQLINGIIVGSVDAAEHPEADVNGDGTVDYEDLEALKSSTDDVLWSPSVSDLASNVFYRIADGILLCYAEQSILASICSDEDAVALLLVSTVDQPIPSGKVSVSYTYTSVRNMFGVSVIGSANAGFTLSYEATGDAYACIALDFIDLASEHYRAITGASAAFRSGGETLCRTSSIVLSPSETGAGGQPSGILSGLNVDGDVVTLLLVSADGEPIPSGTVSVSYTYTSVRNMFGVPVTGSANGSFIQAYKATGDAYACIVLDFAGSASEHYDEITGASAAFGQGAETLSRTSSVVLSFRGQ